MAEMAKESGWASSMEPVTLALRAREEVWSQMPWWWRPLKRQVFMSLVEAYVRTVLVAFHQGAIEGWPPQPDGTPTVDMALQPRRRVVRRRRIVVRQPSH